MIRTINLNGSEMKITELGGDNTEIFNNSSGMVYASKLPNIAIGGDEVIAIPAGAIDGLYGTHGTIYLLGTGSVELRGIDQKITKARGQSTTVTNGTGVSESYVDDKCYEVLEGANAYADIKDSEVVVSVKEYADEKDIETLNHAKEYADSLNAELAGYIGYTDNDIYGLEADFENCVFTRLAGAVGKTAGADFDSVNAYGGRRRCNLSDDGEILAYYGDENFKADGSNGQVMVEQPKFYYRVVPLKTEKIDGADGYHLRKARYYISDTPKVGFKVHPAFMRDGVEVDKIYLSAFEGCIYDTSAGAYLLNDEQIADFDNDKLSSIADAKPCSGLTQNLARANARKLAQNRGTGWEQATIQSISASQILFIIEYASFNSQSKIGIGATGKSNQTDINNAEYSGSTIALGDKTGCVQNSDEIQNISYRGEENLWGNMSCIIDGINVYKQEKTSVYICDHDFSDKMLKEPYADIGFEPANGQGYISAFGYSKQNDWAFITTEIIGNSVLPISDFSWNVKKNDFWALPLQAGGINATNSEIPKQGLFSVNYNTASDSASKNIGARLTFFPISS